MRKILAVAALLMAFTTTPALAVTYGEPDGTTHDNVGLLIFDDESGPAWRCTGTLLSQTVVLTAGHCTYGAKAARIWFENDDPFTGYPFAGGTAVEASEIHTQPGYDDVAFFLKDAGIVILSEPVEASRYGTLAHVGVLDELATKRGSQQEFTAVGYGLKGVKPVYDSDKQRMQASVGLISVNGVFGIPKGTSVKFTNNAGNHRRGGTCFGDSGGPVFKDGNDSDVIVAVTSFGVNANCKGTGGGYRIDQAGVQSWINSFLE
jgi:hypothetical protein